MKNKAYKKMVLKRRKRYAFGKCKRCGIQVSVDTAHHWNKRTRKDGGPALALERCTECDNASRDKYREQKRTRRDWAND